jgi:hypothetical protein
MPTRVQLFRVEPQVFVVNSLTPSNFLSKPTVRATQETSWCPLFRSSTGTIRLPILYRPFHQLQSLPTSPINMASHSLGTARHQRSIYTGSSDALGRCSPLSWWLMHEFTAQCYSAYSARFGRWIHTWWRLGNDQFIVAIPNREEWHYPGRTWNSCCCRF